MGLNFIGEFHGNSSNGFKWIVIMIYYFTRWMEAIPTMKAAQKVIIDFLEENIITKFGIPTKITADNADVFKYVELEIFCFDYGIVLAHLSNYYRREMDWLSLATKIL
jgi:hypothetical protein